MYVRDKFHGLDAFVPGGAKEIARIFYGYKPGTTPIGTRPLATPIATPPVHGPLPRGTPQPSPSQAAAAARAEFAKANSDWKNAMANRAPKGVQDAARNRVNAAAATLKKIGAI